jgi:hypothetical protein
MLVAISCVLLSSCSGFLSSEKNNAPVMNTDSPQATVSQIKQTLQNNDGKLAGFSSPWGDGSELHTPKIAVKFTSEKYPIILNEVDVFLRNESGQDQWLILNGHNDIAGFPDESSNLFDPIKEHILSQTAGDWITIDVPEAIIPSGPFWIVIEWQNKPLREKKGENSFFLGYDSILDFPDRNIRMSASDKGWVDFPSVSQTMGDILLNAIITQK